MMRATLSIRQQLLRITLFPLVVISVILGGYFIQTQLKTANDALYERGHTLTTLLAASAEFGLLTGNKSMLYKLTLIPGKEEDVVDIIFLDVDFKLVTRFDAEGPDVKLGKDLLMVDDSEHQYFLSPVMTSDTPIETSPEFSLSEYTPENIGWVQVILSTKPTQTLKNDLILKGTLLTIVGFVLTMLIALRASQRITLPLSALSHSVERMRNGELSLRATVSSTTELQTLARGINLLAQRVDQTNQSLKARVDRATNKLNRSLQQVADKNEALKEEKRRADEANVAKDAFLARMSHEIRTPLTSILGYAKLLKEQAQTNEQAEYTRIINVSSNMLLSIIDDILVFSKLNAEHYQLQIELINPADILNHCIEMQAYKAAEKGITLIPIYEANIPNSMNADPMKLMQIFTNIIGNAVKFTDTGTIVVRMKSTTNRLGRSYLSITVRDSGSGIPAEGLKHLFEPFAQADNTITRRFGGTGLGLAISKQLIELMEGDIRIHSDGKSFTEVALRLPAPPARNIDAPEATCAIFSYYDEDLESIQNAITAQGYEITDLTTDLSADTKLNNTTAHNSYALAVLSLPPEEIQQTSWPHILECFLNTKAQQHIVLGYQPKLTLPSETSYVVKPLTLTDWAKPFTATPLTHAPSTHTLLTNKKILVADDHQFNRHLISTLLSQLECTFDVVSNGQEALDSIKDTVYDLVLMDVHMPVMDGIEATKHLNKTHPNLPVIALTADVMNSEHHDILHAGASAVLTKPLDNDKLISTINTLFKETQHSIGTVPNAKDLISPEALGQEFQRLLKGLLGSYKKSSLEELRHYSHQLLGVAALYEATELEMAGHQLHVSILGQDIKEIWGCLWRVQRLIEQSEKIKKTE